jgi:hypothetical protein
MTQTDDALRNQLRRSMRAQYNAAKFAAHRLLDILDYEDPDTIAGVTIGDMRDEVEAITKAGHEFSAYYNALAAFDTGGKDE